MDSLKVYLKNCYGISSLDETFDFSSAGGKAKAYSIYAPNGLMKTSFSRTFEALSKDDQPNEERFNRQPTCIVKVDNIDIQKEKIYVLKSEIEISSDNEAVTNILINQESKARYDSLVTDINKLKSKLETSLQKKSKIKKDDIENILKNDFQTDSFSKAIELAKGVFIGEDLESFIYNEIFDPKAISILESSEFLSKSNEFNQRYQELFDQAGTIYTRGIFNPVKADTSFNTLNKQGYFAGGHKVHLKGDNSSIDYEELQEKMRIVHESIDSDAELKKLRSNLAKNAQTQALITLLENISATEVDLLLQNTKPEKQVEFKRCLWAFYVQNSPDSDVFLEAFSANQAELRQIELDAATEAPNWSKAIELFNNRFVDMPFTLSLFNQVEAALGRDKAKLKFTFKDGDDQIDCTRSEIKSLSQGEKRALYLLNFIFEVEDRKRKSAETIFIIDDVADSFDYKNKHAIVQYLEDISKIEHFSQLILTHNFDFFRTLANNFVHRERCLMASRTENGIAFSQAEGIKNYFIGKWKRNINNSDFILCATVPFTRNLIEYIKGEADPDYLKLTSLLHWKEDTDQITIGDYYEIYNRLFNTNYPTNDASSFKELLFVKANEIKDRANHEGLNLEDKVVLSIAIRMRAEVFLIEEIRKVKSDDTYWCESMNQFGALIKSYTKELPDSQAIRTLEKVSITVSSNIHLNSFMYEPILDLTIEHLIKLYSEILELESAVPVPQ
ncbi:MULTISPECIES: hypothetical protein [Marinomonas]|uniref:AAA domain-containing protein n=1 Tax=Marinomonas alcarazii TaxID=491949 RepID=A0A318VGT4_9GAMM|nr:MULTISPECIES: hypothetical protein [Marinomonas]PYF83109.1 hypothetical protein DFP75_102199 [Marinomonas alcarazii]